MMKRLFSVLALCMILSLLFCACSAVPESADAFKGETIADYAFEESNENGFTVGNSGSAPESSASQLLDARKLIKTVRMTVETETFDAYLNSINTALAACNGYVEVSEVSGESRSASRFASYTLRIPADRVDSFSNEMENGGVVVSKSSSQEDVTLTYVDMEARITALKTEEESLLRLLEQADSVESIIYIQSNLTDVRYEIESYESRLRTYDNLIDYATVYLNVREVEREVAVVESGSIWSEIGSNLKNAVYLIGRFFRGLFIFFVSALPYLAIITIITLPIIYFAVIRPAKKRKVKQDPPKK